MNPKEQLAEMARVKFADGTHTSSADLEDEYRAVLRWFAAEVQLRTETRENAGVPFRDYETAMNELLKELSSAPAPASCRKCGERIRGMETNGLCGLCADDERNK